MRNLKKILATMIVLAMMVTAMVPAFADTTATTSVDKAAALKSLGLYTASGTAADLKAKLTRQTALATALRLGGHSAEAKAISSKEALANLKPLFADTKAIDKSLLGFVDYGVSNGYVTVKGTKGEKLNPGAQIKGAEFAAMIWKALGYSLEDAEATIAASKLADLGAFSSAYEAMKFSNKKMTKGDAVKLVYTVLQIKNINGLSQIQQLIKDEVITIDDAVAAGVYTYTTDAKPEGATFWQDFESGSIDPAVWTQVDFGLASDSIEQHATWSVIDTGDKYNKKALKVSTKIVDEDGTWSLLRGGDPSWYNGTLEVTTKTHFTDMGGNSSFSFRVSKDSTGSKQMYNFYTREDKTVLRRLPKSDSFADQTSTTVRATEGGVYKYKVVIDGGHIVVYMNGEILFDVTDSNPLPEGNITLGSWGEAPEFDSVSFVPAPGVASPASISSVTAGVNQLTVALNKGLTVAAKKADFVITKKVGADEAVTVAPSAMSFDINKTFTFTLPAPTEPDPADKEVTYSVSYLGQTPVSVGNVKTVLTAKNIGFSATVTAVSATAAKFQLFNGTDAVSAVAAIGAATPVFGAKAGDVLTVKVFAADGTTLVATSSVTVA